MNGRVPTRQQRSLEEEEMPTGVAIRDPREQLFAAAERVLLADGPNALTSRAVTAEAGVAKGVLHRHFADFDEFLAELVEDRIRRLETLQLPVGARTVADNLTDVLVELFGSVAVAIVGLITFRDGLRARLRKTRPTGVPVLTEATAMIVDYLTAERDLGRIAADADLDTLALTLIGSGHLLFADRSSPAPDKAAVRKLVDNILR
jgi:AcrR family transcriptional regulator